MAIATPVSIDCKMFMVYAASSAKEVCLLRSANYVYDNIMEKFAYGILLKALMEFKCSGLSIALSNLLIFGASLLRKRYKYWLKVPSDFVHIFNHIASKMFSFGSYK
ncbi:hypothetical protein T4D_11455 [Trichinella pseudospiralis]|uniref:Uncharacterized protein n=1 Tax=Trichinella pseudospiralis TaxID=6337 RepID=A0A0V1FKG2_TRIPS|nr:hypothetical protein T4D_11455 [Trichinella pseudospiralis]